MLERHESAARPPVACSYEHRQRQKGRPSVPLIGIESRPSRTQQQLRERLRFLVLAVFLAFGVMVVRLWQLQVVRGEEYYRQTRRNVVDTRMLPSVRGKYTWQRPS